MTISQEKDASYLVRGFDGFQLLGRKGKSCGKVGPPRCEYCINFVKSNFLIRLCHVLCRKHKFRCRRIANKTKAIFRLQNPDNHLESVFALAYLVAAHASRNVQRTNNITSPVVPPIAFSRHFQCLNRYADMGAFHFACDSYCVMAGSDRQRQHFADVVNIGIASSVVFCAHGEHSAEI